jgi:hypothetical protein
LFAKKAITFRSRDDDVSNTRKALDQFVRDEAADCRNGKAEIVCRLRQLKSATLNEPNGIYRRFQCDEGFRFFFRLPVVVFTRPLITPFNLLCNQKDFISS